MALRSVVAPLREKRFAIGFSALRVAFLVLGLGAPAAWAAAAPGATPALVAVLPLQDLSRGRNDVNLPLTRYLGERLAASGNNVTREDTVIAFLGNNRIRTVGTLETFQVARVRDELGAAFVLLGTVTQAKEKRNPSLGVTLRLVRTSDARIVWSYVGAFSTADYRRLLGVGEPRSVADLQPLWTEDVLSQWPWALIGAVQPAKPAAIESVNLQPSRVRPGAEVRIRVRLRGDGGAGGRAPRAFFKADEQLHAALASTEENVYEGVWVAGERDGVFPVTLLLEWPLYGRSETALLGSYRVDGVAPLLELDFKGVGVLEGVPVVRDYLVIQPRFLLRKPLARWRLTIKDEGGKLIAETKDTGAMPEKFAWRGFSSAGGGLDPAEEGIYEIAVEVWDEAGNSGRAAGKVNLDRAALQVTVTPEPAERQVVVDFKDQAKVPLAYWRMEMWSEEGRLLKTAEGEELPVRVGLDGQQPKEGEKVRSILVVKDVLGNVVREEVKDLFGVVEEKKPEAPKEKAPTGASKKWVDEF